MFGSTVWLHYHEIKQAYYNWIRLENHPQDLGRKQLLKTYFVSHIGEGIYFYLYYMWSQLRRLINPFKNILLVLCI
jgi:hypothetical protein